MFVVIGEKVMVMMFMGSGCESVGRWFLKRGIVVVTMEVLEVASWAVETNHPVWFSALVVWLGRRYDLAAAAAATP